MKLNNMQAILRVVVALLMVTPSLAGNLHNHRAAHLERSPGHLHVRHTEDAAASAPAIEKRGGKCQFPTDDPNLVAITPHERNAGWAISPDQECKPGTWCSIACKPGMVMAQWDPDSDYTYPASMNGGLYCNENGEIEKPFKDSPNCVLGTGAVEVVNRCGSEFSICQTVLPGMEDMIIPTLVSSRATIAVPDASYWCSTAAHYYINPPGVGEEGCIWGDPSKPIGNWSPYVAGANTDSNGMTFVKIGWNPIWEATPNLRSELPTFGLEIVCPDGGCNGLPCKIDPSEGEGKVESNESANGAGGSAFCVVTVPKGTVAQIVVFNVGSSSGGYEAAGVDYSSEEETPEPTPEPTTSTPEPITSTTSEEPTTSTSTSSTPAPTTTSTSTSTSTTPTPTPTTTSTTSTPTSTSTTRRSSTTSTRRYKGGIFQENGTTTSTIFHQLTTDAPITTTDLAEAVISTSSKGEAGRQQGSTAVAGLVVAFAAAACLF